MWIEKRDRWIEGVTVHERKYNKRKRQEAVERSKKDNKGRRRRWNSMKEKEQRIKKRGDAHPNQRRATQWKRSWKDKEIGCMREHKRVALLQHHNSVTIVTHTEKAFTHQHPSAWLSLRFLFCCTFTVKHSPYRQISQPVSCSTPGLIKWGLCEPRCHGNWTPHSDPRRGRHRGLPLHFHLPAGHVASSGAAAGATDTSCKK